MIRQKVCEDISRLQEVQLPQAYECEECMRTGDTWVHLRTCQTCGKTHCCDSSKNKHATRHFHQTGHPLVASAEPNEQWLWCYAHQLFVEYGS